MEGAGYIDIHSHIIPEVDDGAKSFEESLAMLNVAYEQGMQHRIMVRGKKNMISSF